MKIKNTNIIIFILFIVISILFFPGCPMNIAQTDTTTTTTTTTTITSVPIVGYVYSNTSSIIKATKSGTTWTTAQVGTYNIGSGSLSCSTMDNNQKLHLVYIESSQLKYGTNSSGSWQVITVDSSASSTFDSIIIITDSSNIPHIAYSLYLSTQYSLIYATLSGSSFTKTTITGTVSTTRKSLPHSITCDTEKKVHIVYEDWSNASDAILKYTNNVNGSFISPNTVSGSISPVYYYDARIVVSADGKRHVLYQYIPSSDSKYQKIFYATLSSGSSTWNSSEVISTGYNRLGGDRSIMAESDGNTIHVVITRSSNGADGNYQLIYTSNSSTVSWGTTNVVESSTGSFMSPSLALTSAGKVHISYGFKSSLSATNYEIRYSTNETGSLTGQTIDNTGGVVASVRMYYQ